MNDINEKYVSLLNQWSAIAAYAGIKPAEPKPVPIKPLPTWSVQEDTIIMTWDDCAICRP